MKTGFSRRILGIGSVVVLLVAAWTTSGAAKPSAPAAKADLAVSMTDSPDPARQDSIVTYSISVSNLGPSQATGVTMAHSYPSEAWVRSAKSDRGACEIGSRVVCSIGNLLSGETTGAVVELSINATGTFINTVSVGGEQNDPARSNNSASTSTEIYYCYACPTLSITDTPDPATAGEAIVYNIKGSAAGYAGQRQTLIVMRIPDGAEFLGGAAKTGPCSYADRTVTCEGGTSPEANIAVRPLNPGQLTGTATLFSYWGSATASAVTTVAPARASGSDTPAPVLDQAEHHIEAAQAEARRAQEQATRIAREAPEWARRVAEESREEISRIICRLTCFKW